MLKYGYIRRDDINLLLYYLCNNKRLDNMKEKEIDDKYDIEREKSYLDYFIFLMKTKGYNYAIEWSLSGDEVPSGGMIFE